MDRPSGGQEEPAQQDARNQGPAADQPAETRAADRQSAKLAGGSNVENASWEEHASFLGYDRTDRVRKIDTGAPAGRRIDHAAGTDAERELRAEVDQAGKRPEGRHDSRSGELTGLKRSQDDDQPDLGRDQPEGSETPRVAADVADDSHSRHGLDRPAGGIDQHQPGEGARGWWEADTTSGASEESEVPGRSEFGGSQAVDKPDTQRPAESFEQHSNRPSASHEAAALPPRHSEQANAPRPDRPLTWGEQLEANREVRYFPGWGPPGHQSSGQTGQGIEGGSGTSFVFGKTFDTKRGMEGLAETKRDGVRTESAGRAASVGGRQADRTGDVGFDADDRPGDQSDSRPDAIHEAEANPERYARERAAELQQMLPEKARGRITMGTGVGLDDAGGTHVVVGTSEPRGYLRPGVTLREGEELATGPGHAETSILDYMAERQIYPSHIGAGRPVCDPCADSIDAARASAASPYKNPNRARDI